MLPTETPWPAAIVLLCVAIPCLVQWATNKKLLNLILGLSATLLIVGCFALDAYVLTPRELITQNVYDLTAAFQRQDVPKTLSFFSPQAKERITIALALKQVHVRDDLRISDVSVTFKADNSLAISHFRANASVSVNIGPITGDVGYHPSRWELDWQPEAGEWKIVKVHRLNPITGKEIGFMATE